MTHPSKPIHRRYLLTSGKWVWVKEPDVEDVETSLMMVPATLGQRQGLLRHRHEVIRMCLTRVDDTRTTYQQLQGHGLKAMFPGAEGVRDLTQLGLIVDRLVNTLPVEDAAVFATGQVADPEEPLPEPEMVAALDSAISSAKTGQDTTIPDKTSTSTKEDSENGSSADSPTSRSSTSTAAGP